MPGSVAPPDPLVIVGPTASGKSALAMGVVERARRIGIETEIISGDSMQVYRRMDIGTAKPTSDELASVTHHLVDVVEPSEEFSVAEFIRLASDALVEISARGHAAMIVGGTGMYLQSLIDGASIPGRYPEQRRLLESETDTSSLYQRLVRLDPLAAGRIETSNRRRIIRALEVTIGSGMPFSSFGPGMDAYPATTWTLVGIDIDRDVLTDRIRQRFAAQLEAGFLDEVENLMRIQPPMSRTAAQALGYKELAGHVSGAWDLDEAVELAVLRTRRFAVRQIRWFRRDPRIKWYAYTDDSIELVDSVINEWLTVTGTDDYGNGRAAPAT